MGQSGDRDLQPGGGAEGQGDATDGTDEALESYLGWIRTPSARWLADYRRKRSEVEQTISRRWGQALDRYDTLIVIAQRALTSTAAEFYPAAQERRDSVYEALRALAIRACQTAKEVRVLMGAGYAPAASTRWRALHEVHVVARLLEIHGAPLAERYLRHNIVEKNKLANATEGVYRGMGEPVPAPIADAIAEVRREYEALRETYASEPESFKRFCTGDYGWATGFATETNFVGLEQAAGLADRRFAYRRVSESIHPNIAGAFAGSVKTTAGESMVLGPSGEGMVEPGCSAALALVDTTNIFLRHILKSAEEGGQVQRELAMTVLAFDPLLKEVVAAFQDAR